MLLHLSVWSNKNPRKARVLMVIGHFIIIYLGYCIARQLHSFEIIIPGEYMFASLCVCLLFLFCYPVKKLSVFNPSFRSDFLKRKLCDAILTFSAIFMTISFFSDGYRSVLGQELAASVIQKNPEYKYAQTEEILKAQKANPTHKISRKDRKVLLRELKFQIRTWLNTKPETNKEKNKRVFLTIFTIVLAVAIGLGLTALACSIACNGSEALALILLLGGLFLLILFTILIVRDINGRSKKKLKDPVPTPETKPEIPMTVYNS